MTRILMGHGSGGMLTQKLIHEKFLPYFDSHFLRAEGDAALLPIESKRLAFTTDSFVVRPLFFPGGDIGKLSVCGTVNDLAVSGARPLFLSAAFILEEGFALESLERIIKSFSEECKNARVELVTADTKVVERGKGDGIFITTSGVGELYGDLALSPERIEAGDAIIVSGNVGDHGAAILLARNELNIQAEGIKSDCAPLNGLIASVCDRFGGAIKFMRDPTRGGLGTVISEAASKAKKEMVLLESTIPVQEPVRMLCEMLGLNPLFLANEGKVVLVVNKDRARAILNTLREHPLGRNAAIIGEVSTKAEGRVVLETTTRGKRRLEPMIEDPLPRIC